MPRVKRYDAASGKWVYADEAGRGEKGNGIKSAVLNADYTLTLTFDDGTSYTTPSIRGATGYTPVRGTDYWTDADKAAIANQVKASLTTETWTFTLEDGSTVNKAVLLG